MLLFELNLCKDDMSLEIIKYSKHGNILDGFIALTTMIVLSFIVLAVSVSISLLGVGEAKNSLDFRMGREAAIVAKGCAEEGIIRVRKDPLNYVGGTLSIDDGSCRSE